MTNDAALAARIIDQLRPVARQGRGRKVFISEAAQALGFRSLPAFKSILVRLAGAGLVELSRCDLTQLQDAAVVEASETQLVPGFAAAVAHFVVVG